MVHDLCQAGGVISGRHGAVHCGGAQLNDGVWSVHDMASHPLYIWCGIPEGAQDLCRAFLSCQYKQSAEESMNNARAGGRSPSV